MSQNLVEDPGSWQKWSPTPALAPIFEVEEDESGRNLVIAGGGNPYCFGQWSRRIPVEGGRTYRYKVRFRFSGINDLNLHALNILIWRVEDKPERQCPQFYIEHLYKQGEHVVGEQVFTAPPELNGQI